MNIIYIERTSLIKNVIEYSVSVLHFCQLNDVYKVYFQFRIVFSKT